jgi:osmotically inducible protein OsmC
MESKATAIWRGTLKEGQGEMTAASGAFKGISYTFKTRFEGAPGTNPEELIAAAHAACFSMALSANLQKANMIPISIATSATVTLETVDGAPTVTKSNLDVSAEVQGVNEEEFLKVVEETRTGCPISRLLTAEVAVSARLAGVTAGA